MDAATETENETVTVDPGELEYIGSDLLGIEGAAEAINELVERLGEELAYASGQPGYTWRLRLPPHLRDLLVEIAEAADAIRGDADYAWRRLDKLAEDGT